MSEFFVGYQPAPPPGIQHFLRRIVAGLFAGSAMIVGVLLIGQQPFAMSTFEYGTVRHFTGDLSLDPHPRLRNATMLEEDGEQAARDYLLVAPGKHGADELLAEYEGARVRLSAQRIYRDGMFMLEVVPDSVKRQGEPAAPRALLRELGELAVTGEIVDSKCYLGVMNPGAGKVHRDCAARCLSGGLPPIFVSTEGMKYVLVDRMLQPFQRDALQPFIAERITIHGTVFQDDGQLLMAIDPATLAHQE